MWRKKQSKTPSPKYACILNSNQNDSTLNGPYENACVKCNCGNVLMIFPLPSQDLYRSLNISSSKKSRNVLNLASESCSTKYHAFCSFFYENVQAEMLTWTNPESLKSTLFCSFAHLSFAFCFYYQYYNFSLSKNCCLTRHPK